jgi:hypothetical protein
MGGSVYRNRKGSLDSNATLILMKKAPEASRLELPGAVEDPTGSYFVRKLTRDKISSNSLLHSGDSLKEKWQKLSRILIAVTKFESDNQAPMIRSVSDPELAHKYWAQEYDYQIPKIHICGQEGTHPHASQHSV